MGLDVLKRIGKTNSYIVRGEKGQEFLLDKVLLQRPLRFIQRVVKGLGGDKAVREMRDGVKSTFRSMGGIGGTFSGGKSYISDTMRKHPTLNLREIVNHEAFHLKPVVGVSETLAHIAGGLNRNKGAISVPGAVQAYKHLWKTRPARAALEHAALGGIGYGGYKGTKSLLSDKQENNQQEKIGSMSMNWFSNFYGRVQNPLPVARDPFNNAVIKAAVASVGREFWLRTKTAERVGSALDITRNNRE